MATKEEHRCPIHGEVPGSVYDMKNDCYLCPICRLQVTTKKKRTK